RLSSSWSSIARPPRPSASRSPRRSWRGRIGSSSDAKGREVSSAEPKAPTAQDAATGTVSLLPMEIQIGDRFTDHDFEWEVVTHPAALHGGKSLRARIRRPGLPETERDMTWPAHVRVEIRRGEKPPERP